MPRLSLWNSGRKGADYRFADRAISEYFGIGGTAAYIHLYLGPYQQQYPLTNTDGSTVAAVPSTAPSFGHDDPADGSASGMAASSADANDADATCNAGFTTADGASFDTLAGLDAGPLDATSQSAPQIGTAPPVAATPSITSIQDVLFLENRDRQYASDVYELRTLYNVGDVDFDLRQFGLFLQNDTLFLEFHLNDMVGCLGRKLMAGDVIELPHRRDDFVLNDGPSINKFYVVQDASFASDGYSPTWWQHIWRVKVAPMTASQEYNDILAAQATNPLGFDQGTLSSIISTLGTEQGINEAVVQSAINTVPRRYFETRQFWIAPGANNPSGSQNPWVFAGDGTPPNGAVLAGSGNQFPDTPAVGDYYLRTDYHPSTLFMWTSGKWQIQEVDWRGCEWSVADRHLKSFINNTTTANFSDGTSAPEKTNLSKAVRPKADF